MGIRPNKTNFGLSYGDFGRANVKKRREEEEKEEKKGMETKDLYGDVWISMILYDGYGFVWILVGSIFLGFS